MTVINDEFPAGRNPNNPHDAKPKASGRPMEPVVKTGLRSGTNLPTALEGQDGLQRNLVVQAANEMNQAVNLLNRISESAATEEAFQRMSDASQQLAQAYSDAALTTAEAFEGLTFKPAEQLRSAIGLQPEQEAEERARVEYTTTSPAQPVEPLQKPTEPTAQGLIDALNSGPEAFAKYTSGLKMYGFNSLEKDIMTKGVQQEVLRLTQNMERRLQSEALNATLQEEHLVRQQLQNKLDAERLERQARVTPAIDKEQALRAQQKEQRYAQAYGMEPATLNALQERDRESINSADVKPTQAYGMGPAMMSISLTGKLEGSRHNFLVQAATPSPRDRIAKIFGEGSELFYQKNNEYGNSIELTGLVGAIAAMTGDIGAARKLVFDSLGSATTPAWSSKVRNKLIDAMVQAAIAIKMLDDGNLTGK